MKEKGAVFIIHQGITDPTKFYTEKGELFELASMQPYDYTITIREPQAHRENETPIQITKKTKEAKSL